MKVTIEFPSWIDESEWEFVGFKQLERGECCIRHLTDKEWYLSDDVLERYATIDSYFCFRKKQKFEWPEWVKDGTALISCKDGAGRQYWMIEHPNGLCDKITVEQVNEIAYPPIITEGLDRNKVYINSDTTALPTEEEEKLFKWAFEQVEKRIK